MTVFRVHLADAPTDVLVLLAEHPQPHAFDTIVAQVMPAGVPEKDARITVANALILLRDMGLVERHHKPGRGTSWLISDTGSQAVADAKAGAA